MIIITPLIVRSALNKVGRIAEKEPFFVITFFLTVIASVFSKPHAYAIHWNVIATLFSLMLVCLAYERCQLLVKLAGMAIGRFKTPRKLGFAMTAATGVLAMLVTNDVALLTVVPLTLVMAKMSGRDPYILVILETLSANLFSALTPFGNPQNLYLYSFYKISAAEFFAFMLPFSIAGMVLLVLANLIFSRGDSYNAKVEKTDIVDRKLLVGASAAFILNILSVLRMMDYRISLTATVMLFLLLAPRLIGKADYFLLATFVLFFLFTDSITNMPWLKSIVSAILCSKYGVLLLSAGLSQVISNVPEDCLT